eukprot:1159221-Pelagomonas_calceolata.AAC.11
MHEVQHGPLAHQQASTHGARQEDDQSIYLFQLKHMSGTQLPFPEDGRALDDIVAPLQPCHAAHVVIERAGDGLRLAGQREPPVLHHLLRCQPKSGVESTLIQPMRGLKAASAAG